MRVINSFNKDWLFIPEKAAESVPDDRFEAVTLPHTNKLFAHHFVDNADYQFISTYRKRFTVAESTAGKRIFIDFDGAMLQSTVYINGTLLGTHPSGFTPFSFDITPHLIQGENLLTVYVDSTEDQDIPPYGAQVDYLTFGGIYRDVYIRIVDTCHITQIFARPVEVLTNPGLECDLKLSQVVPGLKVEATLEDSGGDIIAQHTQPLDADKSTLKLMDLVGIERWSLENPTLYTLKLTLCLNDKPIDQTAVRVGFRTAEFCDDGLFYLNGKPLKLFGLNRHQTYPYIGAAAPARLQQLDADTLKYELGCNLVRTSHYPQSPHFLNRCDEIGLLVFEEIAGWQHIGDSDWQAIVLQDLQLMIERDRNHPSVILWGTRINESPDDDALYAQTNALAHKLDSTRQTGGVRNFIESKFLEDVFTLNDFTEVIQTPHVRPHLITEFGGHMFPTKTWDHEERRIEHALKHVRKHNLQMGNPDVAGAVGWCAFDYHTHREFGSGDRICYHGVMDMDRLPKMAAWFYRSQKSPSDEIVLHAATSWTMGDRSGGGNNPLTIFSNCETVEVLIGDISQGHFQPDYEQYPHLPHPPFTLRWPEPYNPWGRPFFDLVVRGCINGVVVAEHRIDSAHVPHRLQVTANTTQLKADGADIARVAVQIVDKYGNVLPYQTRVVHFKIEGDAQLIGENPVVLLGGQGACYLKARHTIGEVVVHAQTNGLPPVSLTLQIGE